MCAEDHLPDLCREQVKYINFDDCGQELIFLYVCTGNYCGINARCDLVGYQMSFIYSFQLAGWDAYSVYKLQVSFHTGFTKWQIFRVTIVCAYKVRILIRIWW